MKYFKNDDYVDESGLLYYLKVYNNSLDDSFEGITDFLRTVENVANMQVENTCNYAKRVNGGFAPEEARPYIHDLYELDESAARRIIYKRNLARPRTPGWNGEYRQTYCALVDLAAAGIEDKVGAASEGFPEEVKERIRSAYVREIQNILDETVKTNIEYIYWKALRKEIDQYMEETKPTR